MTYFILVNRELLLLAMFPVLCSHDSDSLSWNTSAVWWISEVAVGVPPCCCHDERGIQWSDMNPMIADEMLKNLQREREGKHLDFALRWRIMSSSDVIWAGTENIVITALTERYHLDFIRWNPTTGSTKSPSSVSRWCLRLAAANRTRFCDVTKKSPESDWGSATTAYVFFYYHG